MWKTALRLRKHDFFKRDLALQDKESCLAVIYFIHVTASSRLCKIISLCVRAVNLRHHSKWQNRFRTFFANKFHQILPFYSKIFLPWHHHLKDHAIKFQDCLVLPRYFGALDRLAFLIFCIGFLRNNLISSEVSQ